MPEIPREPTSGESSQIKGSAAQYEGYHFEAFKEIEPHFTALVGKIKEEIDNGTYGLLISDDVGGRLPTMALREIIKERTGKAPKVTFMPGGSGAHPTAKVAATQLRQRIRGAGTFNRALLVSEYALTGGSLKRLVGLLDQEKIPADIALVVSDLPSGDASGKIILGKNPNERPIPRKLVVGNSPGGWNIPLLDEQAHELTGLARDLTALETGIARLSSADRGAIRKAREDAKLLAKRTLEEVWGA
jgi:hypothetical protein